MKKLITLFVFVIFTIGLFGQEKIKQSETGFIFSNFDNFGLSFKKGTNKSMWRFNTVLLSTGKTENHFDSTTLKNAGLGLSIGKERRKALNENFESIFGFDIGYNYFQSKNSRSLSTYDAFYTKKNTNEFGFNFVIGADYVFKNQLVIGIEILPGFNYQKTKTTTGYDRYNGQKPKEYTEQGFSFGFSNSSARLTVAYRFRK